MIRYAQQTDNYSCGPTAIINALKWYGEPLSYRKTKRSFFELCKCVPPNGTMPTNLDRALRKAAMGKMRVTKRKFFTLEELERHLAKPNGSAILRFMWPDLDAGHYILLTDVLENGGLFRTINLAVCVSARLVISRTEMNKVLLRKRSQALCWFFNQGVEMGTLEAKVGALETRIAKLEEEVKLLKEMVKALISRPVSLAPAIQFVAPLQIDTPPVIVPQCNCPAMSAPHTRVPGCHDTWVTY